MISEAGLSALRTRVAAAFKAGMATLPYYTLHGEEHLQELERLALLLGSKIDLTEEELATLRLALVLHDYAMVEVPSPQRELELRNKMSTDVSFADVVRMTHQDELGNVLSAPRMAATLADVLPGAAPHEIEDACVVAQFHRANPLGSAPEHLRHICALMRLIDELDIGPRRAPQAVYEAQRERMNAISRFHWLKHICARPISEPATLVVESRGDRFRTFRLFVAVKGTAASWECLRDATLRKIQRCLEADELNYILRQAFGIDFRVSPHLELCGVQRFLPQSLVDDLDQIAQTDICADHPRTDQTPEQDTAQLIAQPIAPSDSAAIEVREAAGSRRHEFRITALPPELLAETLCRVGRLTVIRNKYITPSHEKVSGENDALSCIFVGAADCGKTRAALEWVRRTTDAYPGQWVVLRTETGTIPKNLDQIVLDSSAFVELRRSMPCNAILFVDDLPLHFPRADKPTLEPIERLFEWFAEVGYFRQRRLVGTIREEDMVQHAAEWPSRLPELGHPLKLLRLEPLNSGDYTRLWEGMKTGAVCLSATSAIQDFSLEMSEEFLRRVSARFANPEAVATFVLQAVAAERQQLDSPSADQFSQSAVQSWLEESWPGIIKMHGQCASVFYTLARLFEPGLRPHTLHRWGVEPSWALHAVLGPALCDKYDAGSGERYSSVVRALIREGHAVGDLGEWVRPRFDFILQAEKLPGVDLGKPEVLWVLETLASSDPLLLVPLVFLLAMDESDAEARAYLQALAEARYLSAIGNANRPQHALFDLGAALLRVASSESGDAEALDLLLRAVEVFERCVKIVPEDADSWYELAQALSQAARKDSKQDPQRDLWKRAVEASRRSTQIDPGDPDLWYDLGFVLGEAAEYSSAPEVQRQWRTEEVEAHQRAVTLDPEDSTCWRGLGLALSTSADVESDPVRRHEIRAEAIEAFTRATAVGSREAQNWYALANAMEDLDDDRDVHELNQNIVETYQKALDIKPDHFNALYGLGFYLSYSVGELSPGEQRRRLWLRGISALDDALQSKPGDLFATLELADLLLIASEDEFEEPQKRLFRERAAKVSQEALELGGQEARAWRLRGSALAALAEEESLDADQRQKYRADAIGFLDRATSLDPQDPVAWRDLSVTLLKSSYDQRDTPSQQRSLQRALVASRREASFSGYRYNLACSLVRLDLIEEALMELETAIQIGDVDADYVRGDPDWSALRDSPRLEAILAV